MCALVNPACDALIALALAVSVHGSADRCLSRAIVGQLMEMTRPEWACFVSPPA